MTRSLNGFLGAVALAALLLPGTAQADPDELMPCKIAIVKAPPAAGGNGMTKFVCRGTFALPSAGAAPIPYVYVDVNADPPGNLNNPVLRPCVGLGNPAGSKGYKCTGPVVLIKTNVVKGVITADIPFFQHGTAHPYASGDLRIVVTTNGPTDTKRYCALFTAPLKNDATQYKSKVAPPPAACSPSGAFLAEDGGLF